ncbi:MAG TPA: CpXC domain-containing protein [Kofleriaceae bacterium]
MSVAGTIEVACPACGRKTDCEIVQSINAEMHPKAKAKLLAGELNVLACECGRRTLLAATLLYHDPAKSFYCQVVTGGDKEFEKAASLMRASGAIGTLRLVPSPNALIEKVKIVDADLLDWAVEMAKVLLLASVDASDLDRVLLFDRVDGEKIQWVLFDGARPEAAASAKAAYDRLAGRNASAPKTDELRIDRAWAVAAVQALIADQN